MVEIDESFKIFQQFRMNNGDSSTGQENEVVDIEKTRTAAGEGSVENERHAGLRNRVIKDSRDSANALNFHQENPDCS